MSTDRWPRGKWAGRDGKPETTVGQAEARRGGRWLKSGKDLVARDRMALTRSELRRQVRRARRWVRCCRSILGCLTYVFVVKPYA